jgi:hypothetical protein
MFYFIKCVCVCVSAVHFFFNGGGDIFQYKEQGGLRKCIWKKKNLLLEIFRGNFNFTKIIYRVI